MKEEGDVPAEDFKTRSHRLFLDDIEYLAFTRRLAWSPDGSVLLTPAGCYQDLKQVPRSATYSYTVYGFSRHQLSEPAFMLPGLTQYATCIRFSPYLYKLTDLEPGLLALPYQMIFAVGTTDQIILFSTQDTKPLAVIGNIHYSTINDLTWTSDGKLLASSSDGYVSIVISNEIKGLERLPIEEVPVELQDYYRALDEVDYSKLEKEVLSQKNNQFMTVVLKQKKPTTVQAISD